MSEKTSLSLGLVGAVLLSGVASHTLSAGELERTLEYRQGVMNVFSWNMKAMSAMMKGEKPYDAKAFARHADDLATAASLDLLAGFPEDSDQGETDALPDIWLDFEGFSQKLDALRAASRKLSDVATSGDKAAMGDALGKTGKTCKGCHDNFKE
ncbi:MAG: cytochrome c [Candidatus Thiodiazotropha sp.]